MTKLLIVEDEASQQSLLRRAFAQSPYTILTAESVASAVELIRSERPDVVLLDIRIGDEDGFDVLRQVRAERGLAATKIVLLSGSPTDEVREIGEPLHADAYLSKPYRLQSLLSLVDNLLVPDVARARAS